MCLERSKWSLNFESEVIIAILKQTQRRHSSHKVLNVESKWPSRDVQKLIAKMQSDGLLYVSGDLLHLDEGQRLSLAVRAVQLGADIERVTSFLHWKEFEDMAAVAFEKNGYKVHKRLRFRHCGRRWEIDLIALKRPIIVSVDCKHWQRGLGPSSLKRIAVEQARRTRALAESLPSPSIRIECANWDKPKFVPSVLSLVPCRFKFHENVPIVPILQLQDFLRQLPAFADSLRLNGPVTEKRLDGFTCA